MTIIDIDAVEVKDHSQLVDKGKPYGLNSEYLQDFEEVIGDCPFVVDSFDCENFSQSDTISLEHPIVVGHNCGPSLRVKFYLIVFLGINFTDLWYSF